MTKDTFYDGKAILVTGGAGFVGTHLISYLKSMGANVTATIHNKKPQKTETGVIYLKCDLTKMKDCIKVTQNIDYVFMAAANSSGAEVMQTTPLVHLTPNIVMNSQMLAASYENKVKKFCFISSNTVYPVTDFAVAEEDANYNYFHKYFIVGWMKQFSEIMCDMYSNKIQSPMQTLVVRPGNLYGPYDKFTQKDSKVIAALIRRGVERKDPFPVWGDGNDLKDFLYIEDFIQGMTQAFTEPSKFQVLNIASGIPVTITQVLNTILKVCEFTTADVQYDTSKPTMIPKRLIDVEKIKNITGWTPNTDLENGLYKTIKWYEEFYKDTSPEEIVLKKL